MEALLRLFVAPGSCFTFCSVVWGLFQSVGEEFGFVLGPFFRFFQVLGDGFDYFSLEFSRSGGLEKENRFDYLFAILNKIRRWILSLQCLWIFIIRMMNSGILHNVFEYFFIPLVCQFLWDSIVGNFRYLYIFMSFNFEH